MKYIVQNWSKENDGILFCIQRLQEMLFHYSDDIVRAPVHNTQTLIDEYISVEKEIVSGQVQQYQLDIITKELKASLLADKILKERYGAKVVEDIVRTLAKKQSPMVHYLSSLASKKQYYESCLDYLKRNVIIAKNKNEIEYALRAWISSVVWYGYSPEYIYRYLRTLFDVEVKEPKMALETFLSRFNFSKQTYKVYFVFHAKLKPYHNFLKERFHISFEDDGNFGKIKKNPKSFVGIMEKDALDSYGAIQCGYSFLNNFLRFYKVFTNKREDLIGKNGLVINKETGETLILPIESQGYKNIESNPYETFESEIDVIISRCQGKGKGTYRQLSKIVNLHNAALKQQDLNDAFVNLWSVLEVVSSEAESNSKIEKVINCVTPILQNDFYAIVFENITTDLRSNLTKEEYAKLLTNIEEDCGETRKIACFILLEKYEKLREDVFQELLSPYPNIRNKIYNLYLNRGDKNAIRHNAENYCKRVSWHIYRLYRVRNAIVHAGDSHKRIQLLGEHLHLYVDRIILELMVKLASNDHLNSIEDVLIDTELLIKRKYNFSEADNVEYSDIELMLEHEFINVE